MRNRVIKLTLTLFIIYLAISPIALAQSSGEPELTPTAPSDVGGGVCRDVREGCEEGDAGDAASPGAPDLFGPMPPAPVSVRPTGDNVVRMVFFWSETCSHCHEVLNEHLPPLMEKYGGRLEITAIETSGDPARYEIYLAAIDLFQVPPQRQGVPTIFIGDAHLLGSIEIPERLDGLITEYLDQGGIDYPPISGLDSSGGQTAPLETVPQSTGPEKTEPGGTEANPIYLAYFYQTGCQDCDRVKGDLSYLKIKFPQLVVEEFNVRDNSALCEWLGERCGVPEARRLTAPTVFVGDEFLLEEDLDARSLESLLSSYTAGGAERVWADWEATAGEGAQRSIVQRFRSLGVFTIVFAGLVDGLNPCAFATLIFFVSYLTISGRKGKEVLSVGAAFTVGVFLAYMLVGVGFYRALDMLGDVLTTLGRWLYGLTAVLCLVLAVVSFLDYLKARRGEIGDMTLNLPHKLRMRINATIRQTRNSQTFVAAAFATGIVVSFLELACTGQVYLPTILFVMSVPELKAQATLFLLLYNLLFVAPLVVVFVLAYYGTGAKQLSSFLQRRASTVKLGMAFLFLALGGWLAMSLV